ncbi:MAG: septum formation initiator family protein [Akkermansia sp.]|nr:septum formation initiator family protein [Akkermansia sp.]
MAIKLPFLRRSYHTLEELDNIRDQRSKGIRHVLGVSALIFLGLVAFLGTMLMLPPMLELQRLHQQKEHTEYQLRKAREEEAEAYSRYIWMTDPEYFEQVARDRADMAKEGEIIIRRPSPADLRRQQKQQKKRRKPAQRKN